ncbi:MAG: hypothetical protein ACK5MY_13250 [Jhaorihella sp.]
MTEPRILRLYLNEGLRQSAEAGAHNFIARVVSVVRRAGFRVDFHPDTPAQRLKSATRRGYALFHMDGPVQQRALTFRRAYHYPFWFIERSGVRWDWPVAKARFPAGAVPRARADRFLSFWRERLFGDAPARVGRDGYVYVPLQGRLLIRRSFQTCAPLDMLRAVLAHDARPVVAALHPNETCSDAELRALGDLRAAHPRLRLVTGEMKRLLTGCDYVATMNSSAGFAGYFFAKPLVLFADIDFHHIAANVSDLGAPEALRRAPDLAPDYAGYLHWFWQDMAINAGRPDAEDKIRAALARGGWPLD